MTQRIEIDGFRIYVLHILAELDPQAAANVDAVIYGHSHLPKIETKNGTLFFNPGSAGPRRFRLPITVGQMSMASCAPKSLSSASSVDIGSARTTCRPRAGSASRKVPELLREAALKKLHEHLYSD